MKDIHNLDLDDAFALRVKRKPNRLLQDEYNHTSKLRNRLRKYNLDLKDGRKRVK